MPKLKVGDTFLYTKTMNQAKLKSENNIDAKRLVGQTLTIARVGLLNPYYQVEDYTDLVFLASTIDDHLHTVNGVKVAKRGWPKGWRKTPPATLEEPQQNTIARAIFIPAGVETLAPNPEITKRSVLEKSIEAIGGRDLNYGKPENNFTRIARRWRQHLRNRFGMNVPIDAASVAMMMVDMKLARLENSPKHLDTWVDIAGYAACGGEITENTTL